MTMSRQIQPPAVMVIITGILFGLFVWNTYFGCVPNLYPVTFGKAQWIQSPEESSQAYFRYEFFISEPVAHAWLKTASEDVTVLYINGAVVDDKGDIGLSGEQTDFRAYNSNIYHIGSYLHPGKNVIGAEVTKILHSGAAQTVIKGAYLDSSGRTCSFFSDSSWKVSSLKETRGKVEWYEEEFGSDSWGYAKISEQSPERDHLYAKIHPDVFALTMKGKQIGDHNIRTNALMFSHSFEIRDRLRGAWLRIASGEQYDIAVNDVSAVHHERSEKQVDIYDIHPLLGKGNNTIRVSVRDRESVSPHIAADCIGVRGKTSDPSALNSSVFLFATDETWQTQSLSQTDGTVAFTRPAVCLSDRVSLPFAKELSMITLPVTYEVRQILRASACILLILTLTICLWFLSAFLLRRIRGTVSLEDSLTADALFHLPAAIFLGILYLLQYDIRLNISFPFQEKFVLGAVGILLAFRVRALSGQGFGVRGRGAEDSLPFRRVVMLITLMIIIGAGISLRFRTCINTPSLSHDEISMAIFARSVLKSGYPFKIIGPIRKLLTTYELLPYPMALSVAILGFDDTAARMPALILGTMTTLLIAFISFRLWGMLCAVLSAGIYAFSPFSVLWGTNAFHPQQTQFFVLSTAYLFYKAIHSDSDSVRPGYFYAATFCFILSYLSWEGSGMILAGLFACLLSARGGNMSWLKSGPLWIGLGAAGLTVFAQLIRRNLSNVTYIMVGAGLSGKIFELAFLSPLYNPLFYVQTFLFDGNHLLLTILVLIGLPFIFANTEARYFFIVLFVMLILLTNFFPEISTRYVYFIQPFLILPASAVMVRLIDYIRAISAPDFRGVKTAKFIFCLMFPAAVFLSSNMQCLRLFRLGNHDLSVSNDIFPFPDYRSPASFIKERLLPDDAVISLMPHTFEYYTGRQSDYYLQENTLRQIIYDVSESSHGYLDKYVGNQVIRNIEELQEVLNKHRRVWIEAIAYYPFLRLNSGTTLDYIFKNTKLVFETYKGKVFLWEK